MNHEANKGQLKARKQGKSLMHKLPADHLEAASQRLNGEDSMQYEDDLKNSGSFGCFDYVEVLTVRCAEGVGYR